MFKRRDIPRAVNISPLPLMRDGRSLRYAWTLHDAGWDVTVVEGAPSPDGPVDLPFRVVPFVRQALRPYDGGGSGEPARSGLMAQLRERLALAYFATLVFLVWPLAGLVRIPSAALYVLHEYRYFPAVYLRAKSNGAKIIYDAHDFYPLVHRTADLTPFWRRRFRPFLFCLEKICVARVDAVMTVNSGIASLYHRTFGVRAKVLRNVYDRRAEVPVDQDIRQKLGLAEEVYLLVVIGNCKPGQQLTALLEALLKLPSDIAVAFVGRGYSSVIKQAIEIGLQDRVFATGSVDNRALVPFVSGADAALIVYYARSGNDVHFLPNGFFQGIAAGLPVLYPNLRWIAEIAAGRGIGVQIDPSDAQSMREGIILLRQRMRDPTLLKAVSDAREEISWKTEETLLLDELAKLNQNSN